MRILAIDLGDVRTGLAFCDELETFAAPLCTITETNRKKLIEKIAEQIQALKIETVVVGNPINMNGSLGPRSAKCKTFAAALQKTVNVPAVLWDERQTTLMANKIMANVNTKKKHKKMMVDKIAAVLILESFLSFRKNMTY